MKSRSPSYSPYVVGGGGGGSGFEQLGYKELSAGKASLP